MSKKTPRFKLGIDCWECSVCRTVQMSGKPCKCGRTYADELAGMPRKEIEPEPMPNKKPKKKNRPPKSRGEFIESYLYRNNETDGE